MPYLFREADLQEAAAWCDQPAPIEMTRLAGRGGAGKTRFAIELCRRMAKLGWVAGLWRRDGKEEVAAVALPRLVVIDYAEEVTVEDRSATELAPVRVVLLTRSASGGFRDVLRELADVAAASLRNVVSGAVEGTSTRALDVAQRKELYGQAVPSFVGAWYPESNPGG